MSVIGTIKQWFQGAAESKQEQLHQAHKPETPPSRPEGKGGIGATPTTVEEAKPEKEWSGDT